MKNVIALLSITCIVLLTSFSLQAKSVAVAAKVKGNAFYMIAGKTKNIKPGTILPMGSEVFTEMGAEVTLNDYYNHVFHLSGSGHISISKNLIELKSGYLWTQSLAKNSILGPMRVITANAEVEFGLGEGIISFDGFKSKTQLLAVKGDFILRNLTKDLSEVDVAEGRFSYVSTEVDEGRPRQPTPVGYSSYQKLTSLFPEVKPLDGRGHRDAPRDVSPQRQIASTPATSKTNFEKALEQKERRSHSHSGEVIFVKTKSQKRLDTEAKKRGRLIASYQEKFKPVVIKKPRKKWKPTYSQKSPVKITIFGAGHKSKIVPAALRIPASVPSSLKKAPVIKAKKMRVPASVTKRVPSSTGKDTAFENQLMKAYQKQMRHKKELNGLIDELKSVDIDYQKEY